MNYKDEQKEARRAKTEVRQLDRETVAADSKGKYVLWRGSIWLRTNAVKRGYKG